MINSVVSLLKMGLILLFLRQGGHSWRGLTRADPGHSPSVTRCHLHALAVVLEGSEDGVRGQGQRMESEDIIFLTGHSSVCLTLNRSFRFAS